jgi:acetoin utilization deacetylase AcuC-like enzyme
MINFPLEGGAVDADYDRVYDVVGRVLDEFDPELLLVSAGFDAHADDPLASMRLTTNGYANVIAHLNRAADRHCPIALITEGGYDLAALEACLDRSLGVLAGQAPEPLKASAAPRAERSLAAARAAHVRCWRGII